MLDREVESKYVFTVVVRDTPISGQENRYTAIVRVWVLDVNEHPPLVDPPRYFIFPREDTTVNSKLTTEVEVQWDFVSKCI